jgi:hypothetical protein
VLLLSACTNYDYDQADTPANQAGFERHFGFPTPTSVTDLYYFADELGTDVLYQLGFKTDPETIEKIVAELDLIQQEPDLQTNLARDFDWWDNTVIENLTPYWKHNTDNDYFWFLWYDPDNQQAYYIEYSL